MASSWTPLSGPSHAIALDVLINGPLSRAELSRRLDLSAASLTRLARPLVEAGLLIEVDPHNGDTHIGRPERPLDVVPTSHHFIGIKLTGDAAYGVMTTLRAEEVASVRMPLTDRDPQLVCAVIAELVSRLADNGPAVTAVGISLGGQAADHAVVTAAPFLHWADVPLAVMVEELTGLPEAFVVVDENDVLRDEGEAYARRLVEAGVRTTTVRYNATIHDFMMLNPLRPSAASTAAVEQAIHVLRKALAG